MANLETATFGAGCFWGIEEIFRKIYGVVSTEVGYMGGTKESPKYEDVCTDETGHAEVVRVTFDSSKVTYKKLLSIFWESHNPTTMNRQGPDVGAQYRSVIFFYNESQRGDAEASKKTLSDSGAWRDEIVTQIVPASTFWRAEEYHQKYLMKHGHAMCHF